ncbi:unnamed protein product [Periconia digitata]|uniref:C2H2-type domain-containing protein n=1 Tax=Periconia digitata TaxID=1303443 RepID=A0A9W4UB05_9PLEO|nr:unnamed protein product [Periconia digitata]
MANATLTASRNGEPSCSAPTTRGRKRKQGFVTRASGEKKFACQNEGCERSFTRAEHLQRHLLNHSNGDFTCSRCRAHFKRRDLLDRHMARHRQKDEEAGREGTGILNTRKRMWKDAEGNIVTKKPTLDRSNQPSSPPPYHHHLSPGHIPLIDDHLHSIADFHLLQQHNDNGAPISPPHSLDPSLEHSTFEDHDSGIATYPPTSLDPQALSVSSSYSPIDQQFWPATLPQPEPEPFIAPTFNDAPFDDIFNPDTAASFNNPFTTMSNYNWLFDMDLSRQQQQQQQQQQQHQPQPHPQMQPMMPDPFASFQFNQNIHQPSHAFDLQLDHMAADKPLSTDAHYGSLASHKTDSPQEVPPPDAATALITPPLTDGNHHPSRHDSMSDPHQLQTRESIHPEVDPDLLQPHQQPTTFQIPSDLERPMSLLQPSRCLPIIDELARAQFLDLVDITQPVAPDGSVVTRENPLLSLSCLQTYCDLFFTRFNTVYPLIHMSTFDPSHVDTLLLTSVLLLGATYGEKDAHQVAVCIHDVVRPQIFANAGFSAKPGLWVLQTILLVECFGKSRAGQKQHDMSHLFHGLLINLIRRSDCQTIRSPTLEDATDDLEDDWRTWVEAEQKKRLAFLCFMWDTQHAVLFCQSLCMSAFELRSNLPSSQSLWEADSAESWHKLHKQQPPPPLFLSILKIYLNPSTVGGASLVPKSLNALSRALVLHGLMSIAWDMQRRDQTSLGVLDSSSNVLGNWQQRLASSYEAWFADYKSFCSTYLSHFPSPPTTTSSSSSPSTLPPQKQKHQKVQNPLVTEFHAHSASLTTLYHAAHILLHTPFLDLQIYAGARHILGRPVARADYARSSRVVKTWVSKHPQQARNAVIHAARLVESGIGFLEDGSNGEDRAKEADVLAGGRVWHLGWTVYLGSLVVWGVGYARPVALSFSSGHHRGAEAEAPRPPHRQNGPENGGREVGNIYDQLEDDDDDDDEDEIIWNPEAEMRRLLSRILSSSSSSSSSSTTCIPISKKGANGMAAVVSARLAKVRWAVVRDAMMVLRGLVCWRLVGDGGSSGGGGGVI